MLSFLRYFKEHTLKANKTFKVDSDSISFRHFPKFVFSHNLYHITEFDWKLFHYNICSLKLSMAVVHLNPIL